ncbi:MAG: M20 family metallopeptidase [Gemmatimonadaceae bacterium]
MKSAIHEWLRAHLGHMRADLRELVELESPSDDPAALHVCASMIAAWCGELGGARVALVEDPLGPHVDVRFGDEAAVPVLLLGHFDTVWPLGTIRERPYAERDGCAFGPGTFDMKAGIVQGVWAMRALIEISGRAPPVRMFFNSDEEVQSNRSRGRIIEAARDACAVLVLEPSQDGALKTARKGAGRFDIRVTGRAAHAGVNPEEGRSAIAELARIIRELVALSDPEAGVSVNVGVIAGGTRANVVAAEARAEVDVRAARQADAEAIARRVSDISSSQEGIEVRVSGGFGRPPMERTAQSGALFELARTVGASLGLTLSEVASGGASDANLCASLGVPILDGLGAVGGGAHAVDENVELDAMPTRAALVGGLINALTQGVSGGRGSHCK